MAPAQLSYLTSRMSEAKFGGEECNIEVWAMTEEMPRARVRLRLDAARQITSGCCQPRAGDLAGSPGIDQKMTREAD